MTTLRNKITNTLQKNLASVTEDIVPIHTDEESPSDAVINVVPTVAAEVLEYTQARRIVRVTAQFTKLNQRIQNMHNRVTFFNLDRNYKCPCKSGKKFKHCCIKHLDTAQYNLGKMEKAKVKLLKKAKLMYL